MDILQTIRNYEFGIGLDPESYQYSLTEGRGRYNKVTAKAVDGGLSNRAVAFQDKVTGSIFKAASWNKPAKTRIA